MVNRADPGGGEGSLDSQRPQGQHSRADPGGGEGSLDSQRPQGQQGGSRGRGGVPEQTAAAGSAGRIPGEGRGPWITRGGRVSRADPGGGEGSLDNQSRPAAEQ